MLVSVMLDVPDAGLRRAPGHQSTLAECSIEKIPV
jgi:hypothetical protein